MSRRTATFRRRGVGLELKRSQKQTLYSLHRSLCDIYRQPRSCDQPMETGAHRMTWGDKTYRELSCEARESGARLELSKWGAPWEAVGSSVLAPGPTIGSPSLREIMTSPRLVIVTDFE